MEIKSIYSVTKCLDNYKVNIVASQESSCIQLDLTSRPALPSAQTWGQTSALPHLLSAEVTRDAIFGKRRQKNEGVFSIFMESTLLRRSEPLISGVMKVLEVKARPPQSPNYRRVCRHDTMRRQACIPTPLVVFFFSLKLFILLRLDTIKTPPLVISFESVLT